MVRRFLHWLVSEHFGQILFAVLSVPVVPTLRRLDVFEAKERQVCSNLNCLLCQFGTGSMQFGRVILEQRVPF